MAILLFLLLMMSSVSAAQDNLTTLSSFTSGKYGTDLNDAYSRKLLHFSDYVNREMISVFDVIYVSSDVQDILLYLSGIRIQTILQFFESLQNVSTHTIYEELNDHCAQFLQTEVKDLREEISNMTCARRTLVQWLTSRLKEFINVSLQESSGLCVHKDLSICSTKSRHCILEYEKRAAQFLGPLFEEGLREHESPLHIIFGYEYYTMRFLSTTINSYSLSIKIMENFISSEPSIEPFGFENVWYPIGNQFIREYLSRSADEYIRYEEALTWGIVRSYTGLIEYPCSKDQRVYRYKCFDATMIKYTTDLLQCVNNDPARTALVWKTAPSFYVHSHCFCVATNGKDCGVKAPLGVDPQLYCLSVLLRDFQKQVTFRPAITYLDYTFQTRVPVCKFSYLLSVNFRNVCSDNCNESNFKRIKSVQCYYKNLVNKDLNCTKSLTMNTFNDSEVCAAKCFLEYVLCENSENEEFRLSYYGIGDSSLVLGLTYLDVSVRVLTLVTYLSCPPLHNLPDKLLIAYQLTALLRLLVVPAVLLEDLSVAVRLDVAMDLAATLWLTAYLHFITVCILDLRPPSSLSPPEVRVVLLRSSLLGWALPAALSAAFFSMDDFLHSHVQLGQLLFVVCIYTALLANLFLFYKNLKFYYEVRSNARDLQKHVKARSVFAELFNFAVKISVVSGAGISFRLISTQMQGLEHVLSYYHALGTIHGLLLFLLYGCNREARNFWSSVFRSTLSRCSRRRRNNTRRCISLELVENPTQNATDPCTEDAIESLSATP